VVVEISIAQVDAVAPDERSLEVEIFRRVEDADVSCVEPEARDSVRGFDLAVAGWIVGVAVEDEDFVAAR
jgi:hypothetical protein